ncbi:MAG TPA: O-antigen ligase family protein [Solirubrobacteraceae bacterium]|nr:O-antigen ligase family protein [Solirubrobacteraceae bacterium]
MSLPARVLPLVIALPLALIAVQDGGASLDVRSVAGVVAWWALLLALAFSFVPRSAVPRAAVVCLALFAGFAAFTGLSALWAPSAERAVGELGRLLLHLALLALPIALARAGDAARWADGLALGIVAVALLALAQRLFPGLLPDDELQAILPESATRLTYPIGYWNGLAIFVALAVPLLLRLATSGGAVWARAAAVAPFPALAGVVYLTSSRGGVAVAAVGAIVFVALTARRLAALQAVAVAAAGSAAAVAALSDRRALVDGPFDSSLAESQGGEAAAIILLACALSAIAFALLARFAPARLVLPRGAAAGVAVAVVVAAAAGVAAAGPSERFREFKAVPETQDETGAVVVDEHLTSGGGSGRWQFWDAALDQFAEHPLAGEGAGSYEAWWAQHGTLDWFVRNAHSLWLETLGELGLVGLLLLGGALATGAVAGAARLRGGARAPADEPRRIALAALLAVLAGFAAGAALDWVWQLPAVAAVALIALGLVVGPATARGVPAPAPATTFGRRALLVLGAWIAICVLLVPFLASEELEASRGAAGEGDVAGALEHAASARALEPWAASPYTQLALLHEEAGDLETARARLADAIERDSRDWRLRLIAARLATKAGDVPAARAALAEARRLNPRSPALSGR